MHVHRIMDISSSMSSEYAGDIRWSSGFCHLRVSQVTKGVQHKAGVGHAETSYNPTEHLPCCIGVCTASLLQGWKEPCVSGSMSLLHIVHEAQLYQAFMHGQSSRVLGLHTLVCPTIFGDE